MPSVFRPTVRTQRLLPQNGRAIKPQTFAQIALLLGAAAAIGSIWFFCAAELAHDRQTAQDRVEQSLQLLSLAVEDDAERVFDSASAALAQATADAQTASAKLRETEIWGDAMGQRARQNLRLAPSISRLCLVSPGGVLWSSRPDTSVGSAKKEKEIFRGLDKARAEAEREPIDWPALARAHLTVGAPFVLQQASREPLRLGMLSAPADDPDATLAIATIDIDHFSRFWRKLDFGSNGAAAIVSTDGQVRVRLAHGVTEGSGRFLEAESPILLGLKSGAAFGSFQERSPFDQEMRLYAWRKLPGRPLVVIAAVGEPQAFASFQNEQKIALAGAGLASFLLAVCAAWLCAIIGGWDRATEGAKRANAIFSASPEPMALLSYRRDAANATSASWRFDRANAAFEELAQCAPSELDGANLGNALGASNELALARAADRCARDRSNVQIEVAIPSRGASQHLQLTFAPTMAGQEIALIGKNVTAERRAQKAQEKTAERMRSMAHYDQLTGLPNRALFAEQAQQAVARAQEDGSRLAIMFIDLDNFKYVNDSRGHAAGDALLIEAARRAQQALRPNDILARLGGDEFVALIEDPEGAYELSLIAKRLLAGLGEPIEALGNIFHIGASIGISMFPEHGNDVEALMQNADAAMYKAKEDGKHRHAFFATSMHAALSRRLRMEELLRKALAAKELRLAWQPQVRFSDNALRGFEALARWHTPEFGDVSPAEFIPIAEAAGLIESLGLWAFDQACEQVAVWRKDGLSPPRVAFNVSALQLLQSDLPARLQAILEKHGLPADAFEAEITESSLIAEPDRAAALIRGLRATGMRVAIDDFGVGYSSLSYLTRFEIDVLKIDRVFVEQIGVSTQSESVIQAIASLARALGARVVAEGVERQEQAHWLRQAGCQIGQGYFFSRPLHADAATARLLATLSGDALADGPVFLENPG